MKLPHLKPRGKRGRVAVKRLGRSYRSGVFEQIAEKAGKRYGSKEAGKRVAASVYWAKVKARLKKGKGGYIAKALKQGGRK